MTSLSWEVRSVSGPARLLFADDPLALPVVRRITVRRVTDRAVVLGSAQAAEVADAERAAQRHVDVVRRRSGGGAVWLDPDSISWIDLTIPHGDPLWSDDVGRAFWWLGDVWQTVATGAGALGACVHRGPLQSTLWSRLVCFGGLGPGEVTSSPTGGAKIVGISQRRTRAGALFQCGVLHVWDPVPLLDVLALEHGQREQAGIDLASRGEGIDATDLVEQFVAAVSSC